MRRHFLTMFTGSDNSSVDLGRVLWALSTISFLGFEFFAICRGAAFDSMTFAGSLSTLAIGHGVALRTKSTTEPEVK